MEQTPPAQAGTQEEVGNKKLYFFLWEGGGGTWDCLEGGDQKMFVESHFVVFFGNQLS